MAEFSRCPTRPSSWPRSCRVHAFLRRFLPDPTSRRRIRPARGIPQVRAPVAREVDPPRLADGDALAVLLMVLFSDFTPYLAAFWGITGCIVSASPTQPRRRGCLVAAIAVCHPDAGSVTEWKPRSIFAASAAVSAWYVLKEEGGKARSSTSSMPSWSRQVRNRRRRGRCPCWHHHRHRHTDRRRLQALDHHYRRRGGYFRVLGLSCRRPVRREGHDAVLHAGDDGDRLHRARLRHTDHRELSHHGEIAAPALAMLGVPQLVSHFFVFYYGVLADITPPVALAAYAGASMAGRIRSRPATRHFA